MLTTLLLSWLLTAIILYTCFYYIEIVLDLPISGQTPCTAHATLKSIIRRVLRDAAKLDVLKEPQEDAQIPQNAEQTYEDLLATAILNKDDTEMKHAWNITAVQAAFSALLIFLLSCYFFVYCKADWDMLEDEWNYNKVIDNYQHDSRRSSSASNSSCKKHGKCKKHKKPSTPSIRDEPRWRQPDLDTTSISSVEDWCRSEASYRSKHVDPVSLTIQHSIEEISTSEDDFDLKYIADNRNLSRNSYRNTEVESTTDREDWQDNWLFSRKAKGSPKPVPVPMLVPSPSTEFRALIGDRDAEDTTDLSETGSDVEDTVSTISSIKNILVDSRTVIGGKNLLENINPALLDPKLEDQYFERRSSTPVEVTVHAEVIVNGFGIESLDDIEVKHQINGETINGEVTKNFLEDKMNGYKEEILVNGKMNEDTNKRDVENEDIKENVTEMKNDSIFEDVEAKNDIVIEEIPLDEESDSLSSNAERDMEYTEKYASFPRPIKKSPLPSPRSSNKSNEEQVEFLNRNTETPNTEIVSLSDEEDPPVSIEGSYSKREKEKWRNPIALKNNPYSKENLDKRLQNKASPNNPLFGRDYYIREAKKAQGGREKLNETEESNCDFLEKSSNLTEDSELQFSRSPYIADPGVFTAKPIIIEESEEESLTNGELQVPSYKNNRPTSLALSSDSDDLEVKRVYNIESGEVHKFKPKNESANNSPVKQYTDIKHFMTEEMLTPTETSVKFDENHNSSFKNENPAPPVMQITSCKNLKSVEVINVPSYEEKVCAIDLSDEYSLDSQNDSVKEDIVPKKLVEIRDISKKYLNSLVKSSPTPPYPVSSFNTPQISIQDSEAPKEQIIDPEKNNELQVPHVLQKSKSDSDVSLISNDFGNEKKISDIKEKLYSHVPNDENKLTEEKRTKSLISDLELEHKPSVRDLRKLFDKEQKAQQMKNNNLLLTPKANKRQVHSLTARSIPAKVRMELQDNGVNETIPERIDMEQEQEEEMVLKTDQEIDLNLRSRISFFENLKNK